MKIYIKIILFSAIFIGLSELSRSDDEANFKNGIKFIRIEKNDSYSLTDQLGNIVLAKPSDAIEGGRMVILSCKNGDIFSFDTDGKKMKQLSIFSDKGTDTTIVDKDGDGLPDTVLKEDGKVAIEYKVVVELVETKRHINPEAK